jgi:ribokinase
MNITVIGTACRQLTYHVDQLPIKDENIRADRFFATLSGRGNLQAVQAARLGANVSILCKFSEDADAGALIRMLLNENIRVLTLNRSDRETSVTIGVFDAFRNHFAIHNGQASYDLHPGDLEPYATRIRESSVLLIDQNIPLETTSSILAMTALHNPFVILHPSPPYRLQPELYPYVTCMTPNIDELVKLTGSPTMEEGVQILLDWGVKHVIATLGEKGCYYAKKDEAYFVEPFSVDPVDVSGAGDAFNAAFAVAITTGKSMREAMIFANTVAALCITKEGCIESLPYLADVEQFIKEKDGSD